MLLIKLFGLLDFVAAALLLVMRYDVGLIAGVIFGIYLIAKGVIFFSKVSMVDILAGLMMVFAGFGSYMPFNWLFVLWLLQKSFFSLLFP